jgi:hypothetical protein
VEDKKFGWQLCYRGSDDGWRAGDFHRKCDDVGPTVILVKCGTNVFGGYTDQSWKCERTYSYCNVYSYVIQPGGYCKTLGYIYNFETFSDEKYKWL